MKTQVQGRARVLASALAVSVTIGAVVVLPGLCAASRGSYATLKHTHRKVHAVAKHGLVRTTTANKPPDRIPSRNAAAGLPNFTPEQAQSWGEYMQKSSDSVDLTKGADTAAQLGKWPLAAAQYQKALDLWPDNPDGLYGLGQCAAAAGDLPHAIGYYRKAIYTGEPARDSAAPLAPDNGLHTNDVKRLMEFALLLNHAGQTAEAVFIYNHAAALLDYERGDVQNGKQMVKVLLPELVAERTQPEQVQYTPERLQALADTALAREEISFGSNKEALAHMREAVKLYPDSAVTNYYLGEATPYQDKAGATAAYQKAVQLGDDKTIAEAKERLAQYR